MVDTFKGYRPDGTSEHRKILDPVIHAVTTIDHKGRLAHDGFYFSTVGKVIGTVDGAISEFLFIVPAGADIHLQPVTMSFGAGDIDIEFFEGVTTSSDGALVNNTFNVDRNSTQVAAAELRAGAVVTDDGIEPFHIWIPPTATGVGQSTGGITGSTGGIEWILKKGSKNLMRVTNNSGETIDWNYQINWYEVHYHD